MNTTHWIHYCYSDMYVFGADRLGLDVCVEGGVLPREDWVSVFQQPLIVCSSSSRGGGLEDSPHPHWEVSEWSTGVVIVLVLLR